MAWVGTASVKMIVVHAYLIAVGGSLAVQSLSVELHDKGVSLMRRSSRNHLHVELDSSTHAFDAGVFRGSQNLAENARTSTKTTVVDATAGNTMAVKGSTTSNTEAPVEAIAEPKSAPHHKEHHAKHLAGEHHKKHHGKHHKADGDSLAEVDSEDDASDEESPTVSTPVVNVLAGHEIIARKRAEREAKTTAPVILRRTLYVREEDGTIHVEKQEVARPGHPIQFESAYSRNHPWSVVDRGIPVDVLLQQEDQEALKATPDANDANPPLPVSFYQANLLPSHGHRHQAHNAQKDHKAVAPPARKPKGNVVHKMNHAKKIKTKVLAKAALKAKKSLVKQAPKAVKHAKASKPQRKAPHRVKMMK